MKSPEETEQEELNIFFSYLKSLKEKPEEARSHNVIACMPEDFSSNKYRLSDNEMWPETSGYAEL